eukprot:3183012-Alexandrium_andersonii.AAC.1
MRLQGVAPRRRTLAGGVHLHVVTRLRGAAGAQLTLAVDRIHTAVAARVRGAASTQHALPTAGA